MFFNTLSTVALLLSAISGTDALRTGRHHRGLESRHAAHVPANKRTFSFAANATAGEQIGKRRLSEGEEGLDTSNSTHALGKRAYPNSRATFYAIGLGACGQYNNEPDFVVALNSAQYGGGYPGPECFKYITITGGPKNGHAVAQIVDECPTCPYGGLDMSIALFEQFATQDDGVASITWWYNDGSEQTTSQAPTTTQAPPTTSQTPTSTWVAPTTTSTTPAYTPPTSSSEQPHTSSTWSSSSVWQAPTTSSSWVAPTTSSTSTWQAPSSSSTWSSSSSVWTSSSSAPAVSGSSASGSGRVSATISNLIATSTRVSTASGSASTSASAPTTSALSDDSDSSDDSSASVVPESSNLDMLSTYTAQLGSLVVVAAQMVIA